MSKKPVAPVAIDITPDWSIQGGKEYLEKELVGFTFLGPGWYVICSEGNKLDTDTLLVLPTNDPEIYVVNVYNLRNPADDFNRVVNLTTRRDDRFES